MLKLDPKERISAVDGVKLAFFATYHDESDEPTGYLMDDPILKEDGSNFQTLLGNAHLTLFTRKKYAIDLLKHAKKEGIWSEKEDLRFWALTWERLN